MLDHHLDQPQLVAALVLIGPIVTGLGVTEHFATRGGRLPSGEDLPVSAQIEYWSQTDPWIVAPGNVEARRRIRALLTANPHNLRPKAALQRRPDPPALPRLGRLAAPTLILVGEADIADVHAHSGAIEAGIADATRIVLPGSGHLPHLETPHLVSRTVLGFLEAAR